MNNNTYVHVHLTVQYHITDKLFKSKNVNYNQGEVTKPANTKNNKITTCTCGCNCACIILCMFVYLPSLALKFESLALLTNHLLLSSLCEYAVT